MNATPIPWSYVRETGGAPRGRELILGPDGVIIFELACHNPQNGSALPLNAAHLVHCVNEPEQAAVAGRIKAGTIITDVTRMRKGFTGEASAAELRRRIAAAREVLLDMIDGAEDGNRGRDSEVSRVLRILDGATGVYA